MPTSCSRRPPRRARRTASATSGSPCPTARGSTNGSRGRPLPGTRCSTPSWTAPRAAAKDGRPTCASRPEHGVIEIGHILWGPAVARTRVATEALALYARHAFDALGYRRFEWKCNARNESSRRAALRFGFAYEGTFRQHMVVKGWNRDTAWFAMTDGDWPLVAARARPLARSLQLRCRRHARSRACASSSPEDRLRPCPTARPSSSRASRASSARACCRGCWSCSRTSRCAAWCRSASWASARERSRRWRRAHPHTRGRIERRAAATSPRRGLGLDEADARRPQAARRPAAWHLAAVYDLAVSREVGQRVNVEGTRNVLEFLAGCRGVERLHYVSTAYVSGRAGPRLPRDRPRRRPVLQEPLRGDEVPGRGGGGAERAAGHHLPPGHRGGGLAHGRDRQVRRALLHPERHGARCPRRASSCASAPGGSRRTWCRWTSWSRRWRGSASVRAEPRARPTT